MDNGMKERGLSEKDIAKLEKDFTHHPPKEDQPERYEEIQGAVKGLAALIMFVCPESRERSLALTKLEECVFWSNASINCNE